MPNVSTYIRREDLSKYLAIHEKGGWSEFIHNALNEVKPEKIVGTYFGKPIKIPKDEWVGPDTELVPLTGKPSMTKSELKQAMKDNPSQYTNLDKIIKSPKDAEKAVNKELVARGLENSTMADNTLKLCKIHGTPLDDRGKCLQKGCKYGY